MALEWTNIAVGVATGYRMDGPGSKVRVSIEVIFSSSPQHADRILGPLNLHCSGYFGLSNTSLWPSA
jgi:hypothetical protein